MRQVVSLSGDGDFLMNGQEFATQVQYGLPIVNLVADNASYGSIRLFQEREVPGEPRLLSLVDRDAGAKRQLATYGEWSTHNPRNAWDRLEELSRLPVLVVNGDNDVLIPSSRSWELMQRIPGAQLIIYPHAGHGFLYQYAELVARHVNMFLDGKEYVELEAKL